MLLLDTLYINNSGGLVLLNYLVDEIRNAGISCYFLIDRRNGTDYEFCEDEPFKLIEPTNSARKKFYKLNQKRFNKVLCFGNIPPPIRLDNSLVITYLHQYFFVDTTHMSLGIKQDFIHWLKQLFIQLLLKNTQEFWVQSKHMKEGIHIKYSFKKSAIHVLPFYQLDLPQTGNINKIDLNFCYISSGAPHKNHIRLLEAWVRINQKYPTATLHLTVDQESYPDLSGIVSKLDGANVINHQVISRQAVAELFAKSEYVIYPSLAESFGLGLVESVSFNCKILAADYSYTHSSIVPHDTFDPKSVDSIEACIRRQLSNSNLVNKTEILCENKMEIIIKKLEN